MNPELKKLIQAYRYKRSKGLDYEHEDIFDSGFDACFELLGDCVEVLEFYVAGQIDMGSRADDALNDLKKKLND